MKIKSLSLFKLTTTVVGRFNHVDISHKTYAKIEIVRKKTHLYVRVNCPNLIGLEI